MFDTNPNRPVGEILDEIKTGSVGAASNTSLNLVGAILAPFAALLVNLIKESSQTAETVRDLTRNLQKLTIWILTLTGIMLALNVGMFAVALHDFLQKREAGNQTAARAEQGTAAENQNQPLPRIEEAVPSAPKNAVPPVSPSGRGPEREAPKR